MVATVFGVRTIRLKWIAVFYCFGASVLSYAECKKTQAEDIPHGANELIELPQKNLNHLHGTVLYFGDKLPMTSLLKSIASQDRKAFRRL